MAEVIVALDVGSAREAEALIGRLPGLGWVKVGSILFGREGPALISSLKARGLSVFLDLKWHDIPHTVAGAVEAAEQAGADLATVHALGGPAMMRAAAEAATTLRLAAVTVLTSHSVDDFEATVGRRVTPDLTAEAARLAGLAAAAGLGGVVTSAAEVAAVAPVLAEGTWIIVPGVRPRGWATDDQRRVAEPAAIAAAGATHLVVGRPILRAEDPSRVYEEICDAAR